MKLIREEIAHQDALDYDHLSKLPVLDSFIKESVRLNPLDKSELTRSDTNIVNFPTEISSITSVYPEKNPPTIPIPRLWAIPGCRRYSLLSGLGNDAR